MERCSVCIQLATNIQSLDRGKMTKPECSNDEGATGDLEKQQQDARAAANLPQ
jgi:hypothetical protein